MALSPWLFLQIDATSHGEKEHSPCLPACTSAAEKHTGSQEIPEIIPAAGIRKRVYADIREKTTNETEENEEPV
jgi:hypothetical protein